MGYRLYVECSRKIDYKGGFFNWAQEEIGDVFRKYCPSFYEEISDSSAHWEIKRDEFIAMIKSIKDSHSESKIGEIDIDTFIDCCEKLIEDSKDPAQFTDPEFIYLDWF